jgi:hypothetical protein
VKFLILALASLPLLADSTPIQFGTPSMSPNIIGYFATPEPYGLAVSASIFLGQGGTAGMDAPFTITSADYYTLSATLLAGVDAGTCNVGGQCESAGEDITASYYISSPTLGWLTGVTVPLPLSAASSGTGDGGSLIETSATDSGNVTVFLEPGDYLLNGGMNVLSSHGAFGSAYADSTVTLTEGAVPEPDTLPVSLGVLLLACLKRR